MKRSDLMIETIREKCSEVILELVALITKDISIDDIVFVKYRIKSSKSIINKATIKKINYDEVYDVIGINLVFYTEYQVRIYLEQIKEIEEVKIKKVLDYISNPCGKNNYRAIHIQLEYQGCPCEIQLKTEEMDREAELSYSKYKG